LFTQTNFISKNNTFAEWIFNGKKVRLQSGVGSDQRWRQIATATVYQHRCWHEEWKVHERNISHGMA
jgi:hypothetical protein